MPSGPLVLLVLLSALTPAPVAGVGASSSASPPGPASPAVAPGFASPAVEPAGFASTTVAPEESPTASRAPESAATAPTHPPDPETDVLGWENGYWYNETINVTQTYPDSGLTEAELERYLARTMARLERLRGLEFTGDVSVRFVSRDAFRAELADGGGRLATTWSEQFWEALFVYGEDQNASEAYRDILGDAVLGYAAEEGATNIMVVTAEGQRVVPHHTLAHELVHVLQDQQFDLGADRYRRGTFDGRHARDGLVEGEAAYLEYRYEQRCADNWTCVEAPAGWSGAGYRGDPAVPVLLNQPYSDGAVYVHHLREAGGWAAVDAAHRDLPTAAERIAHPTAGVDPPREVGVPDRSSADWRRTGTQVVGEVGIYGLLRAQSLDTGEEIVRPARPGDADYPFDWLNVTSTPSAGWAGDTLATYERADGDAGGYVWRTVWDTERDAGEFRDAYLAGLRARGANATRENVWVLRNGSYADAFYVARAGRTVVVVNAPTPGELGGLWPAAATPTPSPTPTDTGSTAADVTDGPTGIGAPGFGPVAAALALLAATAVAAWRHRSGSA